MHTHNLIACFAAVLAITCSAQASSPLLPSEDPFYIQPENISAYKPGDVIRHRAIATTLQGYAGIDFTVKSATQFLYRTTDSLGQSVAALSTFLAPNGNHTSSSKLLAFSFAYDSANNDCSPSYALQKGANGSVGSDVILIQAALYNGWHVVTSDYEGLQAQFLAGVQTGHAVLDSIRASLSKRATSITGLSPHARYAMFGYSGGSIASEWAAELAPAYAPDLTRFVGTAFGGTPANITNSFLIINKGLGAGLMFTGTFGISKAYSNFSTYLKEQLIPSRAAQFYSFASGCNSQAGPPAGSNEDFFSYFVSGAQIVQSKIWKTVFSGSTQMGVHGVPRQPLYIYKADGDELTPVVDTDLFVRKLCQGGAKIEYRRNSFGSHLTEAFLGAPFAYAWLKDRFDGVPLKPKDNYFGCEICNVTISELDEGVTKAVFGDNLAAQWEQVYDVISSEVP